MAFYAARPSAASADDADRDARDHWRAVRHAIPQFAGHRQPRVPSTLGYYDPLDPDVHARQFSLASRFGISAFCYAYAWRPGSDHLRRPLIEAASRSDQAIRYCLRWPAPDLGDDQIATAGFDRAALRGLMERLAPHLADERYLRVDGRSLLILRNAFGHGEGPVAATDVLRERAAQLGLDQIHLALIEDSGDAAAPVRGFDSTIEGFDGSLVLRSADGARRLPISESYDASGWHGAVSSYRGLMEQRLAEPVPSHVRFRTCLTGWDDTPLLGSRGTVLRGDDGEAFGTWLRRLLEHTYLVRAPEHWIVFLNSWNRWSEGAYLEPDLDCDDMRLEALRRSLERTDALAAEVRWMLANGRSHLVGTARSYLESASALARELLSLGDVVV